MPRPRSVGLSAVAAVLPAALLLLFLVVPVLWIAAAGGSGALRALAAKIHDDRRVDMALATVGDGLSVVVKR